MNNKSLVEIWESLSWRCDNFKTVIYRKLTKRQAKPDEMRARVTRKLRRLGKYYEDGNSDIAGYTYHPIPFDEFYSVKSHRKSCEGRLQAILSRIKINKGDWVLDIGANVGYFSFALENQGAFVESYEINSDSFEIGAILSKYYEKNVLYINKALSLTTIEFLRPHYKVVLLLSVFHWILKQEGDVVASKILRELARRADSIFFETPSSQDDAMFKHEHFASRDSVENYLNSILPEAKLSVLLVDPKWGNRILYHIDCTAIT